MKTFMKEFKEFIARGNVMDMAVGVIIGSAFTAIVTSLVNDLLMPVISIITGGFDLSSLCIKLSDAEDAASINYGAFISAIINFLIMALILFIMLKGINALKSGIKKVKKGDKKEEAPAAPEPSDEVKLLTEIKDLLKAQNAK